MTTPATAVVLFQSTILPTLVEVVFTAATITAGFIALMVLLRDAVNL